MDMSARSWYHWTRKRSCLLAPASLHPWSFDPLAAEAYRRGAIKFYIFSTIVLSGLDVVSAAAPVAGSTAAARAGTTTLYRAVSMAEHADIVGSGALRAGPNSFSTGKWFWESAEHATQFATRMDGAGNFRIIEATFPRSAAEQFMRLDRLDGIGPAQFGTFEQLGSPLLRPLPGAP